VGGPEERLVARKPDEAKRQQLLMALTQHALSCGLQGMTLQTLAEAAGTSPRMLIHYFGTAEQMRAAVIREVRGSLQGLIEALPPDELKTPDKFFSALWAVLGTQQHQRLMYSFFELFGMALLDPNRFGHFAREAVIDYMEPLERLTVLWGVPEARRASVATVVLGLGRAFSADFLATGDQARVAEAVTWIGGVLTREIAAMASNDGNTPA
jgi:AcrR family transcriptional regulator